MSGCDMDIVRWMEDCYEEKANEEKFKSNTFKTGYDVKGINHCRGNSAYPRIVIDEKLLICKPLKGKVYAPTTKEPIQKSWGKCSFVGTKNGETCIFMRHGQLVGGYCYEYIE